MYRLVIAIAIGTALLLAGQAGNDPEKQLQAAINKEVVEGDLNGAIDLYKKIVEDNGGNRAVAAQSLLRLGGCYEKLGQEEAQKTYRQLIADYPERGQEVAAARQRLAAITTPPVRENKGITIRKLSSEHAFEDVDTSGSISPDGRFLSYMNGLTGDLAVRDLRTGQSRMLTNKGGWDKSGDFALAPRWSPDGKQIVYYWFSMAYQKKAEQISELRIIDSSGKNSPGHVLFRSSGDEDIIPVGWFPDGKSILAADVKGGKSGKIVRISIDDGKVQVLKEKEVGSIDRIRLSPDGRYIAYDSVGEAQSMNSDIFLLPASGGSEVPIVTGPGDDRFLDWTPDGRHIFFSSNRSGTYDAWLLRVENGKGSEPPELVKQDFGIVSPIGFAPGGEFYFGRGAIMHDVFIADWDADTGKLLSTKATTELFTGATYWPAWSGDGKKLACIVHRGELSRWAENQVRIRDLETGQERTVPTVARRIESVSWSPDGTSLLLSGKRQAGKYACWIVGADSGNVLREIAVTQGEQAPMRGAVWAPDGNAVYYSTRWPGGMSGRIVKHNLVSNNEKVLYSLDRFHNPIIPAVSPDGKFLAFTLEALMENNKALGPRLMLLPTAGGSARELMRSGQAIKRGSLAWSPDSRYIYFARGEQNSDAVRLCRISISDGAVEDLQYETKDLTEFRLSPDGLQIAFTKFSSNSRGEIWVMENFLPK